MLLFNNRLFAFAAALCLGVSRVFWSQAIISEVYTLNAFIYFILLFGAIYYVRNRELTSGKYLALMFFIYGLGLSNHWPLLILSTPSILAVLWPRIREILRFIPKGAVFLVLGLSPYVWMVIRSRMDPVISFYGPLNSWHDIWYMISREGYAAMDHSVAAGYGDKLQFLVYVLEQSTVQLGPVAAVLTVIGLVRQWKYWQLSTCIGLVLAYLGSTLFLIMLLGHSFTPIERDIFKVYPIISYSMLVIWAVLGVYEAASFIKSRLRVDVSLQAVNLVLVLVVISTALISNISYNYRVNDKLGKDYAFTVLTSLEKDAIFFTGGDLSIGTLGYFNLVEKLRPDVSLYNVRGLFFKDRLVDPIRFDLDKSLGQLSDFIGSQQRPVYFVDSLTELYGSRDYGFYHKVDKSLEKGRQIVVENSRITGFAETLLSLNRLYDPWEAMYRKLLLSGYCRVVMYMHFIEHPEQNKTELLRVCSGYYGLITAADVLLTSPEPDLEFISMLLDKAERLHSEAVDLPDSAKLYLLKSVLLEKIGNRQAALEYLDRAIQEWPDSDNPAYIRMQKKTRKQMTQ